MLVSSKFDNLRFYYTHIVLSTYINRNTKIIKLHANLWKTSPQQLPKYTKHNMQYGFKIIMNIKIQILYKLNIIIY